MIVTLIPIMAYIRQRSILISRKPSKQLITRFFSVSSSAMVLKAKNLDASISTLPTGDSFAGSTDKYLPGDSKKKKTWAIRWTVTSHLAT